MVVIGIWAVRYCSCFTSYKHEPLWEEPLNYSTKIKGLHPPGFEPPVFWLQYSHSYHQDLNPWSSDYNAVTLTTRIWTPGLLITMQSLLPLMKVNAGAHAESQTDMIIALFCKWTNKSWGSLQEELGKFTRRVGGVYKKSWGSLQEELGKFTRIASLLWELIRAGSLQDELEEFTRRASLLWGLIRVGGVYKKS